jgi:hypothetical protein
MMLRNIFCSLLVFVLILNADPALAWMVPQFEPVWDEGKPSTSKAATEAQTSYRVRDDLYQAAKEEAASVKPPEPEAVPFRTQRMQAVSFTENTENFFINLIPDQPKVSWLTEIPGITLMLVYGLPISIIMDICATPTKISDMASSGGSSAHASAWGKPDSMMAKYYHQQQAATPEENPPSFAAR